MDETLRKLFWPTKESANWTCSECAWAQPFVQRFEVTPKVPSKAIQDAFGRHNCGQHRRPTPRLPQSTPKKPREDVNQVAARIVREATDK